MEPTMRAGGSRSPARIVASAVAVLCIAGALVLGGLAWRASSSESLPVLESVPPVSAAVTPPTVAPATSATPPPVSTTSSTSSTAPVSPLAALLGPRGSAQPEPPAVRVPPVTLRMDELRITGAPIIEVGVDERGHLEIPGAREIGWYRLGSAPGGAGATVLAAHVSWNGENGVFARLASAEPGMLVELNQADGSVRVYEVVERAQYDKGALPADRIWVHDGPETLVLITCGGEFNPEIRRYRDNIVVYAVPVASS
jgi:hypothetical protein